MKKTNQKYNLKIIENGRLSSSEQNKISGGDCCDPYNEQCTTFGSHECLVFSYCQNLPFEPAYVNCPCGPDESKKICSGSYSWS